MVLTAHASWRAIGRGGKISIVGAGCVLRIENNGIGSTPTLAVVVGLEVTGCFVEAENIEEIMANRRDRVSISGPIIKRTAKIRIVKVCTYYMFAV